MTYETRGLILELQPFSCKAHAKVFRQDIALVIEQSFVIPPDIDKINLDINQRHMTLIRCRSESSNAFSVITPDS